MNRPYFSIILLVFLISGLSVTFVAAQTSKSAQSGTIQLTKQHTQHNPPLFKELTARDRKNYLLTIDQSKIGKDHDTVLYKRKCKVFNVPVKLSNLSNDTLRYLTMSCSWDDFFSINNKKLSILSWPCEKNVPVDKLVLPHKSVTYNISVLTDGTVREDKLKIGMNLLIVNKNKKNMDSTWDLILSDYKTKNLIWSNEVVIP